MLKRVARPACATLANPLVSPPLSNVDGTPASRAPGFGAREVLVVNPPSLCRSVVEKQKRRRIESLFAAAGAPGGVK